MVWRIFTVIGLNYAVYIAYSYVVNTLNTLPLVDVWAVSMLGLGIALIISANRKRKN